MFKKLVDFSRSPVYNVFMDRIGRFKNQRGDIMSAEVNYTPEMEATIREAAPLNMDKAKEIAAEIGKSYRSVIAKAKSLGVEYESKPKPQKRVGGMTKPQMVAAIAASLDVDADKLDGLEKATALALGTVLEAVK